jgi:hypothetical protein
MNHIGGSHYTVSTFNAWNLEVWSPLL